MKIITYRQTPIEDSTTSQPSMESGEEILSPPTLHFDSKAAVTLLVAPEEHSMLVPGNKLAEHSEFFAAALKKEWTEGQTRLVKLPEEDPAMMAYYVGFMFGDDLPTHRITEASIKSIVGDAYELLANLYVLGESMLDTKCRNAIIHEISRLTRIVCPSEHTAYGPGSTTVSIIYDGTTAGSAARRLMIDLTVTGGNADWLTPSDHHPEYLLDVGKAFFEKVKTRKSFSDFHDARLKVEDYLV